MSVEVLVGDCRDLLRKLPDCSIDSVVTDPPYELGFMGKSWDSTGVAYDISLWSEVLRVLKPGGHLLAFSGSRTYHRMVVAIEDAGFEIRDQIMWVYGSGFPKSLDVSKAIDKSAGAERQVVGAGAYGEARMGDVTIPATDKAQQWSGWGTALKPAHEPIVMARKPLGEKTVAENVLRYGTGAINIDASRVGRAESDISSAGNRTATFGTQETKSGGDGSGGWKQNSDGRFPANFIHDGSDEVLSLMPNTGTGSAARFFYCAKASKAERNAGLEELPEVRHADRNSTDGVGGDNPRNRTNQAKQNFHPTVKPLALMRYLVRMVTPTEGTVLDPFTGSGTTLMAATMEGFNAIGMEMTEEYVPIINGRILWAKQQVSDTLF